jgi:hypothetical protein
MGSIGEDSLFARGRQRVSVFRGKGKFRSNTFNNLTNFDFSSSSSLKDGEHQVLKKWRRQEPLPKVPYKVH